MADILRFLNAFELWIYVFLGLVGIVSLRKFLIAFREWQASVFGLERNLAQQKLSESATILVLIIIMAFSEFVLVSFVSPGYPEVQVLPTPTLDILSTPAETQQPANTLLTPNAEAPTLTLAPVAVNGTNGCQPGKVEFTNPKEGDQVSGSVDLQGVINLDNFGFYKYEYAQPGSENWYTIAAGNDLTNIQKTGQLGFWDTSLLLPGDYLLRLVVTDNQGQPLPACVIRVSVMAPQ